MALTNFPNGISSFGFPLIGSGPVLTTGQVFFVSSVTGIDATGRGTDPSRPFATIDFAVGNCTAGKGDTIFVMPGHVETVIASGTLAIDVAGVSVIGIGSGRLQPSINFTTAVAASVTISGAGCRLVNMLLTAGIDALTNMIVVSAADVAIRDCRFRDVAATAQTVLCILTTAAANRLLVDNVIHEGDTANAGSTSFIAIVGGDAIEISNFWLEADYSGAAIDVKTTATTRLNVHDGYIRTFNSNDLAIKDTITGSTGKIGPNINIMLKDNAANITEACTGATFVYFQPINIVNLAGESSMQTNITASTDA